MYAGIPGLFFGLVHELRGFPVRMVPYPLFGFGDLPHWRQSLMTTSRNCCDWNSAAGRFYQYSGVPPAVHQALLQTSSKGSYFNRAIRGQFPYARVSNAHAGVPHQAGRDER